MDDARRRRFSFARSEASSPSRLRHPSRSSAYILYLICTGPRNKEEKKRAGPRGPRGDRRKEKASSGISSRAMKRKGRKPSLKQKTPLRTIDSRVRSFFSRNVCMLSFGSEMGEKNEVEEARK